MGTFTVLRASGFNPGLTSHYTIGRFTSLSSGTVVGRNEHGETVTWTGTFDIETDEETGERFLVDGTIRSIRIPNLVSISGVSVPMEDLGPGIELFKNGDRLNGAGGADFLFGEIVGTFAEAPFGNDFLSGGGGNDHLIGGRGNDTLDGGAGSEDLVRYEEAREGVRINIGIQSFSGGDWGLSLGSIGAGRAEDGYGFLDTLRDVEWIWGSPHDDLVVGGPGFNHLGGRGGNDTILANAGGTGGDNVLGGVGADTFLWKPQGENITISQWGDVAEDRDDSGLDRLLVAGRFSDVSFLRTENEVHVHLVRGIGLPASGVILRDHFNLRELGGRGLDHIEVDLGQKNEFYSPGHGKTRIYIADEAAGTSQGQFTEVIFGSDSAERIDAGGGHLDIILAGDGKDTITGGEGNDSVNGGLGDDEFIDGQGSDRYLGGEGFDIALDVAAQLVDRI